MPYSDQPQTVLSRLSPDQKPSPIYILMGEEEYFIDKIEKKIVSTYLPEEMCIRDRLHGLACHAVSVSSAPASFRIALTTPINAPPAIKPDASRVPLSWRALLSFSSLDLVLRYQLINPPANRGRLRCRGINIPLSLIHI